MNKQEQVDRAARESLRLLGADPDNWVASIPGVDHDVAIIGGAQSGVTISFALRRAGITNNTVIEAADPAHAGGWLAPARMNVLRTPKTRSGPELGNPALSFRAWYEGLHSAEAFDAIGRIARTDWAEYLKWFHEQIKVPVRYETRLVELSPADEGHLRLRLQTDAGERVEIARKVVFATGVEGCGGPSIPAIFADLPTALYAHTGHEIDFQPLRGKVVGVLGAATSALDAAATALEAGATEVHLFSHRSKLIVQPAGGVARNAGLQDNFHFLSNASRWKARWTASRKGSSTPRDTVLRAVAYPNFHLHLEAPWNALREENGKVVVDAADGTHIFDYVIAGTGYQYDPKTRPELRGIADHIALWRDEYEPPEDLWSESLGLSPYLGVGYELTPKHAGETPWVSNIHMFNAAAMMSFGRPVGDVPSLRTGIPRLVNAIARDLVLADHQRAKPAATAATNGAAADANGHVPAANSDAPGSNGGATTDPFFDQYAHAIWKPQESFTESILSAGGAHV